MKIRFYFLCSVAWIALLMGCVAIANDAQIPTGTYISNSGAGTEQLKLAGSDYIVVAGGASVIEGTYSTNGQEITFTTSDVSPHCVTTLANAVYKWSFENNLLTLKLSDDACAYRAALLTQTWLKR